MATLEELVVRIKADASQLDRELKRVGGTVQQSTTRMTSGFAMLKREMMSLAPALGAAALVAFAKKAIDTAGRITDLGQQIGFAASTLSALETPLVKTGSSLDQFAASVNLMNANIGNAVSGNEELANKFARLGLSVEDLQKLSPEEQFYTIADALSKVEKQYEQTEIGRAIFGRGFSALIPLLKESNGELGQTVDKLKDVGDGLSEETLNRIDAFGDALAGAAIKGRNAFLDLLATILEVNDYLAGTVSPGASGSLSQARIGTLPQEVDAQNRQAAYLAKARSLGFQTSTAVMGSEAYGPAMQRVARAAPTGKAVTQQANDLKELSAATEAFLSKAEQAKKIFDDTRTPLEKYNEQLGVAKLLYEEGHITLDTFTRQQEKLTEALKDTQEQGVITAKVIKDYLGDAFESALFDAENFGDSVSSILNGVARQIARSGFIDPLSTGLSNAISGAVGGGSGGFNIASIFSGLGFADGGRPPVGKASWIGEEGPELWVPDSSGTIIPNHATGGQQISVTQVFHVSPGLQGTVEAEVRRMAPTIAREAQAGVFRAIERGGAEARIVGRRG